MGLFTKKEKTESSFEEEDLNKFSLFMMEVMCKIHFSKEESQNNRILNILMGMRDYEVRDMVVAELKQFSYQQRTANWHEVDNRLLLSKIDDMVVNLDSYKDKYMVNKYNSKLVLHNGKK
jgi:hypothetical protein